MSMMEELLRLYEENSGRVPGRRLTPLQEEAARNAQLSAVERFLKNLPYIGELVELPTYTQWLINRDQQVYEALAGITLEVSGGGIFSSGKTGLQDPATGEWNPRVADALTRWRVGGGSPSIKGYDEQALRTDPLLALMGARPQELLARMRDMPDELYETLQHRLFQAGFYEDLMPDFGMRTEKETVALDNLVQYMLANPGKTPKQVVDEQTEIRLREIGREISLSDLSPDLDQAGDDIDVLQVRSIEAYEDLIDQVSADLVGMDLDPAARRSIANRLRQRELASERQKSRISRAVSGLTSSEGGTDIAELDAFMHALGIQESGGNYDARNSSSGASGKYQIMPANWPSWARLAGLPSNAPMTPENQELVARHRLYSYYQQYRDWGMVAAAWYAGAGGAARTDWNRPQANGPTIREYVDSVLGRFNERVQAGATNPLAEFVNPQTGEVVLNEFDAMSEADRAIRAATETQSHTYSFAKQATEFFNLLGGVV